MLPWSRFHAWFCSPMPPERLALLRIGVGIYAVLYLLSRAGHLNAAAQYPSGWFAPIGITSLLERPASAGWVHFSWAGAVLSGTAFTFGVCYRFVAPVFGLLLLWVLSYRHSFGMIFHTDNLLVLHVLLLSVAPVADTFVVAFRRRTVPRPSRQAHNGWVVRSLCMVTVASYVVAAVAKLETSGWGWLSGDALREQIAYDTIRKIELGSIHSPLGPWLLPHGELFPPLATFSLGVELLAPLALLGPRCAAIWCLSAWAFHMGVLGLMAIVFPYPISGAAFLSFFPLERWAAWVLARRRLESAPSSG